WYRIPFKPDPKTWNRAPYYITSRQTFDSWTLGRDFLYGSSVQADRLLALSRIPNLLLGALLVGLIGRWSYRLWGSWAAVVAMWLGAVDPNLVANSAVVTCDIAPTLFSLLTMYLLWEYA